MLIKLLQWRTCCFDDKRATEKRNSIYRTRSVVNRLSSFVEGLTWTISKLQRRLGPS